MRTISKESSFEYNPHAVQETTEVSESVQDLRTQSPHFEKVTGTEKKRTVGSRRNIDTNQPPSQIRGGVTTLKTIVLS